MLVSSSHWTVAPVYGWWRTLFPVYSFDQLIFLVVTCFILVALSGLFDETLAVYISIGAYVGFAISMFRSTPSEMSIPSTSRNDVLSILNDSPHLLKISENEWTRNVSRFHKWSSDNIYLVDFDGYSVVGGRFIDIQAIKQEAKSALERPI